MKSNHDIFRNTNRSLIIAPAGYGKTHTICECILQNTIKSLILTHTHAGVASIKNKLKENKVQSKLYQVETISGFVQRYVLSFGYNLDLPEQKDKSYFEEILKNAVSLFAIGIVKNVVAESYIDIYVDEYQDCTKIQHKLILELSEAIPVHILGDPLQSIFGFAEEGVVDWQTDLVNFNHVETLTIPWRWQMNNPDLGTKLDAIRKNLMSNSEVILSNFLDSQNLLITENYNLHNHASLYYKLISSILNFENQVLLIHPESSNLNIRLNIIKKFNNRIRLVESIDHSDFYNLAEKFDNLTERDVTREIIDVSRQLFKKTEINNWFNDKGIKKKVSTEDRKISKPLQDLLNQIILNADLEDIASMMIMIKNLPNNLCYRKELFDDLISSLRNANLQSGSVCDAMYEIRSVRRRVGKAIKGKNIGTTLLTKGLEFETVIVLDANKFKDINNFYVAITRATKNLYIISESDKLSFNN